MSRRTVVALLARKRRLVLRLSIVVQDPAGNRRTVREQVTP